MSAPYYNPTMEYFGFGPDDPTLGIPKHHITDDEQLILKKLRQAIAGHVDGNKIKQEYYEARQTIKNLEIAVPAALEDISTACGWAGTVVDVYDERIDFLGWHSASGELMGLDDAFADNDLRVQANYGSLDSLITGLSLISVGTSDDGGDLVAVESSSHASVLWDYRKRRSTAGLSQTVDDAGNVIAETLYLDNVNLTFERRDPNEELEITSRVEHDRGRCFMTRMPNKGRPYQLDGRSEITRPVRYYTDAAVRTMLGMEVNREFYTAPQRFVLNAKPEDFGVTEEMSDRQKFRKGLSVAMGMVNIVPPTDREEHEPKVIELHPAPPTPYIEQVKAYSTLLSAETGMPVEYFGFTTDNPPSADSIRQREYRLVKRAGRRIGGQGVAWREVALLILLNRNGDVDRDFMRGLTSLFADPSTPTRSATADEIQKYIAAGALIPDSSVTYRRMGLSEQDQKQLEADKAKYEAKQLRQAMQQQAMAAATAAARAGTGGEPSPTKAPQKTAQGSQQ